MVFPSAFEVGGVTGSWRGVLGAVLAGGVAVWAWSVVLILTRGQRGELVTTGPYAVVKHPAYTAIALLVLPSLGLLFGSWLGIVVGLVFHVGSRRFAPRRRLLSPNASGANGGGTASG